jgi:DNA primase
MNHPAGRESDWDRVKNATDIVRLVGEHVKLKAKGREYVGLCPFHDDHSPSMYVIPAKQIFHCFVCGAGGDCFAFTKRMFRMEPVEALKHLAERANVELTPWKPSRTAADTDQPVGPSRADTLGACAFAAEFFRTLLKHPEHGQAGRAVIQRRAITPEMTEQFALGVSANRWDGLLLTLRAKGLREQAALAAGLLKKRDSGEGCYDAFRNRLMFPIHDALGRVIAFGGRKIDEADEPKYINSPETAVFHKSKTLYGLHHASQEIRRLNQAVVTEGYTDTIACHQAGVRNVVATLGTALTREHAALLARSCNRVVLLFDGDEAGQRAADRAVEVFFAEPLDVTICTLSLHTDAKDPDELLKRQGGAEVLRKAFDASTDLLDYRFQRIKQRLAGAKTSAIATALGEEIDRLRELGLADVDPIKQRLIIKHLASLSGLDDATIRTQIGVSATPRAFSRPRPDAVPTDDHPKDTAAGELRRLATGRLSPAEALLGCLLADGDLFHALPRERHDLISPSAYSSALVAKVADAVALALEAHAAPALDLALAELRGDAGAASDDAQSAATTLARRVEGEAEHNQARLRLTFDECLRRSMLDHALSNADNQTDTPATDIKALIELKRKAHQTSGGDRRRLPRFRDQ